MVDCQISLHYLFMYPMKYRKTDRYIYREIAGEGVLVPVKDGVCNLANMLILNSTSTLLWEKFAAGEAIDRDALLAWMLDEYTVEKEQAERDIDLFLHDLIDARCLACA